MIREISKGPIRGGNIHGHFKIPKNTVMLGSNFESPSLRWTKITDIDKIDPSGVHGHIFAQLRTGCDYIVKKNLTGLIGLQVLGCDDGSMSELILDQGTIMLESTFVKNTAPTRIIGWKFEVAGGSPYVCSVNETHAVMTSGNHKIFNIRKPLPNLENIDDLKAALAMVGVI